MTYDCPDERLATGVWSSGGWRGASLVGRATGSAVVAALLSGLAGASEATQKEEAAQVSVVRGIVTDPDGRPLAGVQVYVQGGQTLEVTDSQGRFVLRTDATGG